MEANIQTFTQYALIFLCGFMLSWILEYRLKNKQIDSKKILPKCPICGRNNKTKFIGYTCTQCDVEFEQ